ncbi:MAG: hypothetical protein CME33_14650 [Gimesia sp.]|nr:glycosyltransferase family 39 protein [Gimesia sp.]MAX37794.1 hypothetical protein [Gimesia sp.]|tara:strand:+ start:11737 stop:13713 length:1977 start_codon:yes stop_codon:yes gene_type:complete
MLARYCPTLQGEIRYAVIFLLLVQGCLLAWQAYRYSPTADEPAHLASGISHWKSGDFDLYRVNPPLVRMVAALPILVVAPKCVVNEATEASPYSRREFTVGRKFLKDNDSDLFWYFTLARWVCIPFSLVGGYICYRWACDLYGHWSGLVALVLWCFCPNIIGNGALITPDVAAASLGVLAGYFFWRWLRAPDWLQAFYAGLALGLALLAKLTWVILFALLPVLWLSWVMTQRHRLFKASSSGSMLPSSKPQSEKSVLLPGILQLTIIFAIAVYLINLGYGFENSWQRLDEFQFISRTLGGTNAHAVPGNWFTGRWLGALPVPVPANYLMGIDVQRYDFERDFMSYLCGEHKKGGWWYYYLYAMGVKMPVGVLLLISLRIWFIVCCIWRRVAKTDTRNLSIATINQDTPVKLTGTSLPEKTGPTLIDEFVLILPAIVVLILVSSQTGINRGLRYALPAFPFIYIWISKVPIVKNSTQLEHEFTFSACWAFLTNGSAVVPRIRSLILSRRFCIIFLALISALSSLAVFPHSLSYFNEFVGPANGPEHLLDENIDWGQDLLELKIWCDSHPESHPLYMLYYGFVKRNVAGIQFKPISPTGNSSNPKKTYPLKPGWYAVSINDLYRSENYFGGRNEIAWLNQRPFSARVGYSIRIFHIVATD